MKKVPVSRLELPSILSYKNGGWIRGNRAAGSQSFFSSRIKSLNFSRMASPDVAHAGYTALNQGTVQSQVHGGMSVFGNVLFG